MGGWCEVASMAGPIASVAGCGIFKVRPSPAGASTPRRICSGFAPTVAALRSVGSARGALTVTRQEEKRRQERGQGQERRGRGDEEGRSVRQGAQQVTNPGRD